MNIDDLRVQYDKIKAQSEVLAGGQADFPRRIAIFHELYRLSNRNYIFPCIAAHIALWAIGYFETGGSLGRMIAWRYFYNSKERAFRIGLLREFAENFRSVNRQVCVDTYADYKFTERFGETPGADAILEPELLDALNRVHNAKRTGKSLNEEEKRTIFIQSLHSEQENTVAPGIAKAIAEFDCPIMRFLCMKPVVRFAFFPRLKYFFFRDFSNKEERIEKGMRTYAMAEKVGWDKVHESMQLYGQMPQSFFDGPAEYYQCLIDELVKQAEVARGLERISQ